MTNGAAVISEPDKGEAEQILRGKFCAQCARFQYERGQKLIKQSFFLDMLRTDCKLSNLADNVNPQDLGACDVFDGTLTHRFAGSDCAEFSHRENWLGRLKRGYY